MKQDGNIIIILLIVAVAAIGVTLYYKSNSISLPTNPYQPSSTNTSKPISTNSAQQTKIFQSSETLKFSINVPANYQVEEKFTRVTLTSSNGIIYISRSATNFNNLDDYLKDLEIKNHFTLSQLEKFSKDSLTIISGFKGKEKEYFVYADGWVYLISTSSESLYDELDQIAQSFKYTP